jgi:hypothetical protein
LCFSEFANAEEVMCENPYQSPQTKPAHATERRRRRSDGLIGGSAIMLISGLFLFYAYAWASMVDRALHGIAYWSEILSKMLLRFPDSLVIWASLVAFLMGGCVVLLAIFGPDRRR